MKSIYKLMAAVTILAFILGYLPAQQAQALEIKVTNTNNGGAGSLRQAVADASPGYTITFAPKLAGQTITLTSTIDIGKPLTIDGSGLTPHVKISGGDTVRVRVFNITGSHIINISHLDIINGDADDDGGGIYNSANTLTITDVTFSNNSTATNGGAIFNGGILTVTDSTFLNNSADYGGAIYHYGSSLAVTGSKFKENAADSQGGAIYNQTLKTITEITSSKFIKNIAWDLGSSEGGAIYNDGTIAIITATKFDGNKSDDNGGAIYNGGTITSLERSTFSYNGALNDGGGIYNSVVGSLLVVNSTFSGNDADQGGGILSAGLLTVTNATFSENDAPSGGGGIAASTTNGFNLTNTILANSTSGGDCYNLSGNALTTDMNNLIETNSSAPFNCGTPLIEGEDPQLSKLAKNGFKIAKTHMLQTDSPALDAIPDGAPCPDIDQRGKPRPVDGDAGGLPATCDIGAVERQRTLVIRNFRSQAAYDGQVLETGEKTNIGGLTNDFDFNMKVGDDTSNRQYRAILSFYTKKLPNRAVVNGVILRVKKAAVLGKNPFAARDLLADIRKGAFGGNKILQSIDFQAPAKMNSSGIFGSTPLTGGWYEVTLVPEALRYINTRGVTQFRLRFDLDDDNDFKNDIIMFYTGDTGAVTKRPLLNVEYYVP